MLNEAVLRKRIPLGARTYI